MSIEQVQKILGHKQIDTTLRYAMVNQNNVELSHIRDIASSVFIIQIQFDKEIVMKLTGPYPTMYNRDEIFFRLGIEKSEELLQKIKSAENPNFQDDIGFSYLHMACQAHYLEAIEVLLKMGANPNINDKKGHSPVLEAIGSINENNNAILELMLKYGLDLDKMEGEMTLKEMIESFDDDEMNRIINRYYNSSK